ncbi:MAG TPA: STAS domain-containing protein [Nocardioidaceae bacterium]
MTTTTESPDSRLLRVETAREADASWVRLHGEADIATLPHLAAALDGIELDGARCWYLDVTGLEFADVATLRQLATFARQVRRSGHEIRTCGANATLRKVASLLRVQDDLGLS